MRTDRILALLVLLACLAAAVGVWARHDHRGLSLAVNAGQSGKPQVAILDVYGVISGESGVSSPLAHGGTSASQLLSAIRRIRHDGVKVILLRVDSPGGTAAASQAVYEALMNARRKDHVKVVASMGDMGASGAYYISAAADRIVANPATLTGSIGVIIEQENVSNLLSRWGVSDMTVKSGPHKDLLSPFKPPDAGDRRILQSVVDDTYAQFLQAVSVGRHIPLNVLRPLADGRVFTGRQALPLHLVDQLGNYDDALILAGHLAGAKDEPTTRDYTQSSFWSGLVPHLGTHLLDLLGAPRVSFSNVPLALME